MTAIIPVSTFHGNTKPARVPEARARAPGSVGNIGVGFDLLGHAVDGIGDVATVRRIDAAEVRITRISGGAAGIDRIPLDAAGNTAGAALISLRAALALPFGFEVALDKGIALGSGLGGSASSAVAALVAANALLDAPLMREALYPHALEGEYVSTGSRQGDNVGPMLLGGLALATPNRLLRLPVPAGLHAVVVHPSLSLETRRTREVLTPPYPLSDFVAQSSALALFLTGLSRGDLSLVREGLRDVLVEPRRAPLIPGLANVREAALDHGALGAGISGGGPSLFGWFASRPEAEAAAPAMRQALVDAGHDTRIHVTAVDAAPAGLLEGDD